MVTGVGHVSICLRLLCADMKRGWILLWTCAHGARMKGFLT